MKPDTAGRGENPPESLAKQPGRLVLCGVPIGNLGDASPRLAEALSSADVVAAEDTRRLYRLVAGLGITLSGRVISYFEANERERTPGLVAELQDGRTVVLVTDAGMPAVSDPGFRLVAAAAAAGYQVTVVPGPSSVTTALAISGLPSDRWTFEGFLPRKSGERRRRLAGLKDEERTMVVLEAPHRVAALLADAVLILGADRLAVLCRELTKTYEEVVRDTLAGLAGWADLGDVRGEVTIVIAGAPPGGGVRADGPTLAQAVSDEESVGATRREAIAAVMVAFGASRREVYNAVLAEKGVGGGG